MMQKMTDLRRLPERRLCPGPSGVLSFPVKVITHRMEAVVSYYTHDAAAREEPLHGPGC